MNVLIILGFPPVNEKVVEKFVHLLPSSYFTVLGINLDNCYYQRCGLGNARMIRQPESLLAWLPLLSRLWGESFDTAVFIGGYGNVVCKLFTLLSGANEIFLNTASSAIKGKKIALMLISLLIRISWRLILFLLTIPVLIIHRFVFSGCFGRIISAAANSPLEEIKEENVPPVSIVIPNYNGKELLTKCLPSLEKALEIYQGGGEVILVDDASSDGTVQWVKDNLRIDQTCVFVDFNKTAIDDFRLMSNCKHFIIANSSFSWWEIGRARLNSSHIPLSRMPSSA